MWPVTRQAEKPGVYIANSVHYIFKEVVCRKKRFIYHEDFLQFRQVNFYVIYTLIRQVAHVQVENLFRYMCIIYTRLQDWLRGRI